jgi:hypothetical protein
MPPEMLQIILEFRLPVAVIVEIHPSIHSDRMTIAYVGLVLESKPVS